ncbi:hypothetical protein AOL_s00080g139 [Orbilia oligospora ATCC 24927]|uniref:Protein prenyltransferase alpha subunit repeat-containing protein 1 n=2 Tax=Orbilia oligospora TaxID=2813651 RepID=G1XEA4_ARTOA|nr:hypothetical protein AOL_s00080g139 [Orbilia oligospora ATCC 24927]EGX48510.1 hypothetical protein AOL_s00080g139 [Orbilia oligospora ATCC 24927]KAF3277104.1 hypothetical protein TWF970_005967 [Orbilia oligospora]
MAARSEGDEGVCREVYARISGFFQSFKQQTVQIELLPFYPVPPTHIFVESTSLGIPKSSLWKAFRHARPLFFSTLSNLSSSTSTPPTSTFLTLLNTSAILLLHDSEHLTAINARKRVLITLFPPGTPFPIGNRGQELPISPQSEYFFITSLLTSPLHRHTKSPHLWSHRRWLITTYPSLKHPIPPPPPGAAGNTTSSSSSSISSRPGTADNSALTKSFRRWCRKEVSTVLRAAEAHPKNYYAWTYARWLVSSQGVAFNHEDLVSWCMKHPGDVSGWNFLAWLWTNEALAIAATQGERRMETLQVRYNQLFSVLKYSHNTAPGHEALWGFVRAVVGGGVFDEGYRRCILDLLRGWDSEVSIRAVEDVVKEKMLLRETVRGLEAGRGDSEMVDLPG